MTDVKEADVRALLASGEFDEDWYVEQYPDVTMLGMTAAEHYAWIGRKLGRTPRFGIGNSNVDLEIIERPKPSQVFLAGIDEARQARSMRWLSNTANIAKNDVRALQPINRTYNPKSLNIHWIFQDFSPGSGGHMSILRMVRWLERFGHKQTLWLQNAFRFESERQALDEIRRHFQPLERVVVRFLEDDVEGISGDVVIATDMWTPFAAVNMPLFKERFYFVQDYEALFHPTGSYSLLADLTYRMGLRVVCAGEWLRRLMSERFGLWARAWELAYDDGHYYPNASPQSPKLQSRPRIAFYARQATSRRAVELGLVALGLLAARGVQFHVDFFGQDGFVPDVAYSHTQHGVLTPKELGELYRECTAGIVFSATNYSLIPMEMMACGLPVVELDVQSTRAVFPEDAVQFVDPKPSAIADAVERLLDVPERREMLIRGGKRFIAPLSWERSARALEAALLEGLAENNTPVVPTEAIATTAESAFVASVIIPTFNGGEVFKRVLDAVLSQELNSRFEVLVLDSGSTDGTDEYVKSRANRGVRLHQIPNKEFQHGRTRNLAASLTSGEFIAVLTHDALPADKHWLRNLIRPFQKDSMIAGVFGAHRAYPEASPYLKRDIHEHFEHHKRMPQVMDWYTETQSHPFGRLGWQQWLHFFSDNNAALRRSVWEKIPYPEVNWGEDQVWAYEIIKQGYKKAYAHDAAVYHSHNYSYDEKLRISQIEGFFFAKYFGYAFERSLSEVERCIDGLAASDYAYGRKNGLEDSVIFARMLEIEATVIGRFRGRKAFLESVGVSDLDGSIPLPPRLSVAERWHRAAELVSIAGQAPEELPAGFDPFYYLFVHPDLTRFACNPYHHYLHFGRSEGRSFSFRA